MKKLILFFFSLLNLLHAAQEPKLQTLLKDKISIRAIQIWDGKVWYSGTDSKFGYVSLKDTADKKQMRLSSETLQFRTLAQDKRAFYAINIGSPAYFFKIDKKTLKHQIILTDTLKSTFFDAFVFDKHDRGIAVSDPTHRGSAHPVIFFAGKPEQRKTGFPTYYPGEAHFAASNTNIVLKKNRGWIATGGSKARIFKFKWNDPFKWRVAETPFVQGTSSQGIYSIDFYDKNFGIAVGGDYMKQTENINNIATTHNGGATWAIQASGKNGGYKTCVKIRPGSKVREIIAVGDQNIEFSTDFGKTWTTISNEKGLYVCEWIDENTVVFAGKDRIVKMELRRNVFSHRWR